MADIRPAAATDARRAAWARPAESLGATVSDGFRIDRER